MASPKDHPFLDASTNVDARGPGRPAVMLRLFERAYPDIWDKVERAMARGKRPAWASPPPAKIHPIITAYTKKWAQYAQRVRPNLSPRQVEMIMHGASVGDTRVCVALALWRMSKGVYVVDPTLASAVAASTFREVPFEVLQRMPEHCVYVAAEWDTQSFVMGRVLGFFAHLTLIGDEPRLLIELDTEHGLVSASVTRATDGSITGADEVEVVALTEMFSSESARLSGDGETHDPAAEMEAAKAAAARRALALVLQLCVEEPDVDGVPGRAATPTRTRKGLRPVPPEAVRVWNVGVRLGAALRKAWEVADATADGEHQHGRPRAHLRKAHYHHFWRGSKSAPEQRHLIMRWVHQALVNAKVSDDLAVAVRTLEAG